MTYHTENKYVSLLHIAYMIGIVERDKSYNGFSKGPILLSQTIDVANFY